MDSAANNSVENLVWTLHRYQLLEAAQLAELRVQLGPRFREPRELAKEMLQRGWLTPFQVNLLLNDRGASLVFGAYLLLERLGEGATGQVFKARHLRMKRVVALKMLRPELLTDPEVVQRFYREVQVISQLSHPHIVHAFDAGHTEQTHYLVMEYVEGADLGDLVKKDGPLPLAQACECIFQAALGLQHAHERGLVHRDIKPSNLILASGGRQSPDSSLHRGADAPRSPGVVKILDLGLARLPRKSSGADHTPLTMNGTGMMGTPDYLAPEQALDFHEVDIRADLYSLGCTFYYLLAGEPPFPGGTLAQKLMCHQQKPPPPLDRHRSDVPADVEAILQRLLAKRMEDRYPTPAALAEALAPIVGRPAAESRGAAAADDDRTLVQGSDPPFAVPVRPRRLRWLAVAALVLVLTGALFLFAALRTNLPVSSEAQVGTSAPAVEDAAGRALQPLLARHRHFLEDGIEKAEPLRLDLLDFQRSYPGTLQDLHAAQLLHDLPSPLDRLNGASIRNEQRRGWNPREMVALLGDNRGRSWTEMTCLTVSGDGKVIAGGCPDGHVCLFNSDTLLDRPSVRGHLAAVTAVCLSADGQTLVGTMNNGSAMVVVPAESRGIVLRHGTVKLLSAALAPGEKLLAIGAADSLVYVWEPLAGAAWKIRTTLKGHANGVPCVAFSADGKWLASGGGDGAIRLWDVSDSQIKERGPPLKGHTGALTALTFSPDSRFLVSASMDKTLRLWPMHEPEKAPVVHKQDGHPWIAVAVRPDGKQLATASAYTAEIQLWALADGEPRKQGALTGHTTGTLALAFLPDSKTLASTGRDRRVRLWNVAATPPQERKLLPDSAPGRGGGGQLALSPDNKMLTRHGRFDDTIQRWDLGEAAPTERDRLPCFVSPGLQLAFAPDGKSLCTSNYGQVLWCPLVDEPLTAVPLPPAHKERLVAVAFARNGKAMASAGSTDQTVHLWDLTHGTPAERNPIKLSGPKVEPLSLCYHPDGKTLVIAASDHKLHLWDVTEAHPRERGSPLGGLADGLVAGGFSPDGRVLVTMGNKDGRVTLWNWAGDRPQLLRSLGGDDPSGAMIVQSWAFAPDGKTVAVAGFGVDALAVWNVATGRKLHGWRFPGPVQKVEFSADGRHLITANGNGTTCILRLAPPPH